MRIEKTRLPSELQWKRTIEYVSSLPGRSSKAISPIGNLSLWVVRTPHRLLNLGDVLVVTCTNGMVHRYGMSGVSSKGARLNDYYIPLRRCYDIVELPGDLIGLQWDDPAIGRFVADLRASSRRRVGAFIPAPPAPVVHGQGEQDLRFDGCYRSRRLPRHKRLDHFDRNFLRFFPDGKVVAGFGGGFSPRAREWFIGGMAHGMGNAGRFVIDGDHILITILFNDQEVERYEGKIDGERLRLSRRCRQGWAPSREDDVYKFGAWTE